MLGKSFFVTESHNPDLPPETYDELVYENTTAGNYSTSLSWGKYKIVISGGGGGGAAAGWNEASGTRYAENGHQGAVKNVYVSVFHNDTLTINGIIGTGGGGARARARHDNYNVVGSGGAGYQNGANGQMQQAIYERPGGPSLEAVTSGGGGGGSTSVEWDNTVQDIAAGGNGGTARQSSYKIWGYGGTGGSGGTTTGTGAAGGTGAATYGNSQQNGTAGSDGYIRIYKSNLMPEPI